MLFVSFWGVSAVTLCFVLFVWVAVCGICVNFLCSWVLLISIGVLRCVVCYNFMFLGLCILWGARLLGCFDASNSTVVGCVLFGLRVAWVC